MDAQLQQAKDSLKKLDVQKESLELEAQAIVCELEARNPEKPTAAPMGVDTPLVDAEGYPRNDIDVYRARQLRSRLHIIRTDHKELMKTLDQQLHQLAVLQKPPSDAEQRELQARQQLKPKPKFDPETGKWIVRNWDGTIAGTTGNDQRTFDTLQKPASNVPQPTVHSAAESSSAFAKVNSVAPKSPAEGAGLYADDKILAFGPQTGMEGIADLVSAAAATKATIELRVQRGASTAILKLRPRPWDGRGLLGCHIVPV